MLRALIWDVDGTVAETEADGHRIAFNQAFEACGLDWHWDLPTYGRPPCRCRPPRARPRAPARLHGQARRCAGQPRRPCRPGTRGAPAQERVLCRSGGARRHPGPSRRAPADGRMPTPRGAAGDCHHHQHEQRRGPVFQSVRPDLARSLRCHRLRQDAPRKKPAPQAYLLALRRLGVTPQQAFAIEDSPNGLRAARAAGLRCGITCSRYFADAGFEGAAWLRPDLETPRPMTLQTLQALDGAAESETRPRGRP